MVENNAKRVPRVYAVKENPWADPFIAFTTYDGAFECASALVRGKDDAVTTDYIVELPYFDGAWRVEQ